jgi:hypothetical protein
MAYQRLTKWPERIPGKYFIRHIFCNKKGKPVMRQDRRPEIEFVKMKAGPETAFPSPIEFQIILEEVANEC